MSRDLLAHLADRFVTRREDLATEALLFLLNRSEVARESLVRLLRSIDCNPPETATFRSQVAGASGEIPDVVGVDANGSESFLIEVKFWAGLTENQPVTYLSRLEHAEGRALVFLVPQRRMELLWLEISQRVEKSGRSVGPRTEPMPGAFVAPVGDIQLGVLSWSTLLGHLAESLSAAGQHELRESLGQLEALCEREDREGFLPLEGHELCGSIGRRLLEFGDLIDDAVDQLVAAGLADKSGVRRSGGYAWYGRYVMLERLACLVHLSARKWSESEETPIWVRVTDSNWNVTAELRRAMDEAQASGALRYHESAHGMEVPIRLPLGAQRTEVLDVMVAKLRTLARVAEEAGLPTADDGKESGGAQGDEIDESETSDL